MTGRRDGTVGEADSPQAQASAGADSKGDGKGGSKAAAPCPICGKPVLAAFRPFCSQRCADVDLGRWLGERYVIPGPETGSDENGHA